MTAALRLPWTSRATPTRSRCSLGSTDAAVAAPSEQLFAPRAYNIAVHHRRGDVSPTSEATLIALVRLHVLPLLRNASARRAAHVLVFTDPESSTTTGCSTAFTELVNTQRLQQRLQLQRVL